MTILETFIRLRDDLKIWVANNLNQKANISYVDEKFAAVPEFDPTEIQDAINANATAIDTKVDKVEGKVLSTNDYTTAEKDKLATVEPNANFYEHPTHVSHSLGLYKVTVDESGHVSGATLAEKEDIVALGIPEQDTTYDTEISDLSNRIDGVQNSINAVDETLDGVSKEFTRYQTTNNEAVSTNASGIEANKIAIEAIQGDYLKSTDKTQLQDDISKVSDKATENASAIEILNGEGEGSVKQSIDNAFNEFAANVTNDDVVNTYKELIDYAAEHGSEFTELVGKVDTINIHVGEVETNLANYKSEVSERFTETDTTINNHVTNTNNPHGVTKEQVGLANVDNTSDMDKPISNAVDEALQGKADSEHMHEIGEVDSLQDLLDELRADIDTNAEDIDTKADLEHDHNDLYYTKDEILESITVEDIDDICEFNQSSGGDLVNVATEEWVRNNYTLQTEFSTHNTAPNAHSDIRERISQLSSDKVDKSGMTLGVHTDGFVYLFINGIPQGNGLDIKADVIEGDVFGYVDENNVVVLNGALADGTYTIKYEMEDGSIINIGNLVLDNAVYYSITNTLTNCTSSNSATQAVEGESYSATITAKSGYELKSVTVTMGGSPVTVSGGTISIANVTGNIVITAVAEEVVTAEPKNFAEPNTTNKTDISIWCNDARLGSGGTYRENSGTVVTNFIPFTGDILYVDGMSISLTSESLTNSISFWDENKGFLVFGTAVDYITDYGLVVTQDTDGVYVFDFSNFSLKSAGVTTPYAYIRLCGTLTKAVDDVVIKVKRNGEWIRDTQAAEPVTQNIALRDGYRLSSDGGDRTGATGYCATERINLTNIPKPCTIHLTKAKWAFPDTSGTGYIMTCAKNAAGTNLVCTYTNDTIGSGYFTIVRNNGKNTDLTVTVTSNEVAEICFSGSWSHSEVAAEYPSATTTMLAEATLTYTPAS